MNRAERRSRGMFGRSKPAGKVWLVAPIRSGVPKLDATGAPLRLPVLGPNVDHPHIVLRIFEATREQEGVVAGAIMQAFGVEAVAFDKPPSEWLEAAVRRYEAAGYEVSLFQPEVAS